MINPLALPTPPSAARVFFGYRAPFLRDGKDLDDATRQQRRASFFKDLGETFMPGTPHMQAPLGLAAYLPAVLDPPAESGLPDEAALIVYASRSVYDEYRETSLSRRMYTKSHAAVFDMERSPAAFPASIASPTSLATGATANTGPLEMWHLFDVAADWQTDEARFLFFVSEGAGEDLRAPFRDVASRAAEGLRAQGVDQVIAGCAPRFAAMWLHAPRTNDVNVRALVPPGVRLAHDLPFTPAWVRGDRERGVTVKGVEAFNLRFSRELRHFGV